MFIYIYIYVCILRPLLNKNRCPRNASPHPSVAQVPSRPRRRTEEPLPPQGRRGCSLYICIYYIYVYTHINTHMFLILQHRFCSQFMSPEHARVKESAPKPQPESLHSALCCNEGGFWKRSVLRVLWTLRAEG